MVSPHLMLFICGTMLFVDSDAAVLFNWIFLCELRIFEIKINSYVGAIFASFYCFAFLLYAQYAIVMMFDENKLFTAKYFSVHCVLYNVQRGHVST